jgi:AraC family transcriptional regulator
LKKNLYQNKINKVCDYLQYNNIAGANLKELSQIADLSPFHFHRIFKAVTGETLGEFIIRIKLEKAAKLLSDSKASISQIAYDVGFETPSSLSKAFKKSYNVSPTQYRQGESIIRNESENTKYFGKPDEPLIQNLQKQDFAYYRIIGSYDEIKYVEAFNQLELFFLDNDLAFDTNCRVGICYDDPNITSNQKCRYDICIGVEQSFVPNERIGYINVPGGKFAVFTHRGSLSGIESTYNLIYKEWLMNSQYEIRDALSYDKFTGPVPASVEEITEVKIFLPIY